MGTATAFTSERSKAIEDKAIVSGSVDALGNLTLIAKDGSTVSAGNIKGVKGDTGDKGTVSIGYLPVTALPSEFPIGVSTMTINAEVDYPSNYAIVTTVLEERNPANRGYQMVHRKSGTDPGFWWRSANGTGWSQFVKVAGTDYVDTGDATTLASAKSYTDGLIKTVAIVGAVDLNTYLTPGTYSVDLTADALAGTNYPSPATAGLLEVDANPIGTYVYQRYIPYGPYGNVIFVRGKYNGTWYPWSSTTGGAYVIQMGTGTVPTGVSTALGFASAPMSPANGYTRATNRITVPGTGTYSLSYRYRFIGGTTGTTRSFVDLGLVSSSQFTYTIANDTGFIARAYCGQNEDAGEVGAAAVALQAGAQIGANAYQTSGASRQIDGVLTIQRTG